MIQWSAHENPTGDVADPPGITPHGVFFGIPHEDPLEAADGIADFAPILAVEGAELRQELLPCARTADVIDD